MTKTEGVICARIVQVYLYGKNLGTTQVTCILPKEDHPRDWHLDGMFGQWDELEEAEK